MGIVDPDEFTGTFFVKLGQGLWTDEFTIGLSIDFLRRTWFRDVMFFWEMGRVEWIQELQAEEFEQFSRKYSKKFGNDSFFIERRFFNRVMKLEN